MMMLKCNLRLRMLLLLVLLVEVKTLEEEEKEADSEGGSEDDFFKNKCARSQLKQHMWEFKKRGSVIFLPRLRDVKKLYPGDKFTPIRENMCQDHGVMCPLLAELGHCTGSDWQSAMVNNEGFRETFMTRFNFTVRHHNLTNLHQLQFMLAHCRSTCREHLRDVPDTDLPEELLKLGGYDDNFVDAFGVDLDICDLSKGKPAKAMEHLFSVNLIANEQSKIVPKLTERGFVKRKIPKDVYAAILTNRKKLLNSGEKWKLEYCANGIQNCMKIYDSEQAQECHTVSSERYWFLDLEEHTKNAIFNSLRPLAEKWTGNKFRLTGTSVYGLRKYTRGARLDAHLDHMKTHVVSAILNINQKVDSDWPLQIFDHQGELHHVMLKAGEMIWYESAKLVHGRSIPFNGTSFENIFIHFMPLAGKRGRWYNNDFALHFGAPVEEFTLEKLVQADMEDNDYFSNMDMMYKDSTRQHPNTYS